MSDESRAMMVEYSRKWEPKKLDPAFCEETNQPMPQLELV